MSDPVTQCALILADLQAGKAITPQDAYGDYACMRLAARIFDLKEEGWEIETTIQTDGRGTRWACYRMKGRKAA